MSCLEVRGCMYARAVQQQLMVKETAAGSCLFGRVAVCVWLPGRIRHGPQQMGHSSPGIAKICIHRIARSETVQFRRSRHMHRCGAHRPTQNEADHCSSSAAFHFTTGKALLRVTLSNDLSKQISTASEEGWCRGKNISWDP